jgi:hypothetical protein
LINLVSTAKVSQNENAKLIAVMTKPKLPAIKELTANALVINVTKQLFQVTAFSFAISHFQILQQTLLSID